MTSFRSAALLYGAQLQYLDHLAPLCAVMEIPLIVTEEKFAELTRIFYPSVEVLLFDYHSVAHEVASNYDIIFHSLPRDLFDEVFFFAQKLLQKRVHTIWCPHGNSDKGNASFFMEALRKEEIVLVYGKQMIEFLKRKGVFDHLKAHVIVGNYRHQYYLAHQSFYDNLAEREFQRHLNPKNRTLLYAPTWKDYEDSSSFDQALLPLLETLPSHYNLIVKLHPNLLFQEEFAIDRIMDKYAGRGNLIFASEFAPVYPLLNICDAYIGDMSSIGYDFLLFNKPMFFLNSTERNKEEDVGLYLYRCGIEIKSEQFPKIFDLIDHYYQFELRDFSQIRKDVYDYAFAPAKPFVQIRKEIEHSYSQFPDPELNFF